MLGHQLLLSLSRRHDVRVTLTQALEAYRSYGLFTSHNAFFNIDVRDAREVRDLLQAERPDAVINAVGVIKQREEAKNSILCTEINELFPHRLRSVCEQFGIRLIHISTDCVFDGVKGDYRETDRPNARDVYGKSKALGELTAPPALTLRTSIIGLELKRKQSLVEWFLAQRGTIKGFTQAIYTGLTTLEMARVIERCLVSHPRLTGLWQVASEPITKFELLRILAAKLGRTDIRITPDDTFVCDRSLNGEAFAGETGYKAPSWDGMLGELAEQIHGRQTIKAAA
jgi:dTDP-4-dehydrorhamnose reductase